MNTKKQNNAHERAVHRIKIIKGHIAAIQKMIEEDYYCVDIVHQSLAIQKALKQLDMLIIKDHLEGCVTDQIKTGKADKAIEELLSLYKMK